MTAKGGFVGEGNNVGQVGSGQRFVVRMQEYIGRGRSGAPVSHMGIIAGGWGVSISIRPLNE